MKALNKAWAASLGMADWASMVARVWVGGPKNGQWLSWVVVQRLGLKGNTTTKRTKRHRTRRTTQQQQKKREKRAQNERTAENRTGCQSSVKRVEGRGVDCGLWLWLWWGRSCGAYMCRWDEGVQRRRGVSGSSCRAPESFCVARFVAHVYILALGVVACSSFLLWLGQGIDVESTEGVWGSLGVVGGGRNGQL